LQIVSVRPEGRPGSGGAFSWAEQFRQSFCGSYTD